MGRADGGSRKLRGLLAENPEWESDLLGLYGFDIWDAIDGRVPLRKALALLQRLPHEPNSLWRAEQLGGPEHVGWSHESYLLAEQVDADKALLAIKTHKGKGRVKMPDPTYRPKVKEEKKPVAKTLDDFDVNVLMAQMSLS